MALDVQLIFEANVYKASEDKSKFKDILTLDHSVTDTSEHLSVKKRCQILIELYDTEVSYLLQLELLIHHFMQPLKTCNFLPNTSFELIFGNITQLYNINKELLITIRRNPHNINEAFTTFAPYLKLYSIYAYGYKKALETLEALLRKNKKLHEFVKQQQTRPEVAATLISLLIAPIQRVPRYRLLLQSLLQTTPPHHPDYRDTKDALVKVEDTATHINRLITEAEEGEAMVKLARRLGSKGECLVTPGRKILKEGIVQKTPKSGGSSQQRYLVLLTDALLVCRGGDKGPLGGARVLPLRHVAVEPALGSALFKVTCEDVDLLLHTAEPQQGAQWISAIQDAVRDHAVSRRTLRKESSKRAVRQRRLVGVAAILQRARQACSPAKSAHPACLTRLKRLQRDSPTSI